MKKSVRAMCAAVAAATACHAQSTWIGGATGGWHDAHNWDPGVPGEWDDAVFDGPGDVVVTLNGDVTVGNLVAGWNAGGVTLVGDGVDRTLTLRQEWGFWVEETAGPVVIGSAAPGEGVGIRFWQTTRFNNESATPVKILNPMEGVCSWWQYPWGPAMFMAGAFDLPVSNSISGGTHLGRFYDWGNWRGADITLGDGAAFGNEFVQLTAAGSITSGDFPRTLAGGTWISAWPPMFGFQFRGDAPLALTGHLGGIQNNGNDPEWGLGFNATAPVTQSGPVWFANEGVSVGVNWWHAGSGADARFTGGFFDTPGGLEPASAAHPGVRFTGVGADVSFTGHNRDYARSGAGLEIMGSGFGAYNTISFDSPGGAGDVITPFSTGAIIVNSPDNEAKFYLKPLRSGLKLPNAVYSRYNYLLGFTGENDLTLTNSVTSADASGWLENLSSATLRIEGPVNVKSDFTITGCGTTVLAGPYNVFHWFPDEWSRSFHKEGPGTLVLEGFANMALRDLPFPWNENEFYGDNDENLFAGGRVILDYGATAANKFLPNSNWNGFRFAGVEMLLKGGDFTNSVAPGNVRLETGASRIGRVPGDPGASVLDLNWFGDEWHTWYGGTMDIEPGAAKTTFGNTGDLLPAFITVGGADFASRDAGGMIVPYAGYSPSFDNGAATLVTGNAVSSASWVSLAGLKIDTTGGGTLTIPDNVGLQFRRAGAILVVGDGDYTITGGAGSTINNENDWQHSIIIHHYGTGTLAVNAHFPKWWERWPGDWDFCAPLVKTGPGTLSLENAPNNDFGHFYINGGVVVTAADGPLGSDEISLDNGALRVTGLGFATSRGWNINHNGGAFDIPEGVLELNGQLRGPGALTKMGAGGLRLNAANNLWGPFNLDEGLVQLGHDNALQPTPAAPVSISNGATLDLNGNTVQVGNLFLNGGTLSGNGSLGAYAFNVREGEVSATLADFVRGGVTNAVNLRKTTAGAATLSGANTYTGNTFVEDGALFINGSVAGAAHVTGNGVLSGNGNIARTVLVLDGGVLFPSATLTLGRHLMIQGGAFRARAGAGVLLANGGRVILENAELDVVPISSRDPITLFEGGSVEGIFNNLPEGAKFTSNGRRWHITYANGAVLTPIQAGALLIVR